MRARLRRIFLLLIALLGSRIAFANEPDRLKPDPSNWARSGKQVWATTVTLDANTTTFPLVVGTKGSGSLRDSTPVVIGWDTMTVVACRDQATACWTLSSSVTIGSQAAASTLSTQLIDSNQASATAPSGGACITLSPNERWTMIPDFYALTTNTNGPGYRAGICSAVQAPRVDIVARRPFCRADGDCTDAGVSAGTCSTTNSTANTTAKRNEGGAFLVLKGLNANTKCTVTIER